jgi:hypothetical protein
LDPLALGLCGRGKPIGCGISLNSLAQPERVRDDAERERRGGTPSALPSRRGGQPCRGRRGHRLHPHPGGHVARPRHDERGVRTVDMAGGNEREPGRGRSLSHRRAMGLPARARRGERGRAVGAARWRGAPRARCGRPTGTRRTCRRRGRWRHPNRPRRAVSDIPDPVIARMRPGETRDIDFTFANAIPTGDSIIGSPVITADAGVTIGSNVVSGTTVKVFVTMPASAGATYRVHTRVGTSGGRTVRLTAYVHCVEDA